MDDVYQSILNALEAQSDHNAAVRRFVDVVEQRFEQEERLIAEIRDELHECVTGLSNRLEALTTFVTTEPVEVAERMVRDADA